MICPACGSANTGDHESPYVRPGSRLCRRCLTTFSAAMSDPPREEEMMERRIEVRVFEGAREVRSLCAVCRAESMVDIAAFHAMADAAINVVAEYVEDRQA